MQERTKRCETCKWWERFVGDSDQPVSEEETKHWEDMLSQCRIRSTLGSFPHRRAEDWCGEWTALDTHLTTE